MATKTKTLTVSGVLTRCRTLNERETDWNYGHRYSPNTEHRVLRLDCALMTDDGQAVYFKTPASPMYITLGGYAAIVHFPESRYDEATDSYVFPADHSWFLKEGSEAVATPGHPSDVRLVSRLREGDRITVSGRVKTETVSKRGNSYTVMSHVKRLA